MREYESMKQILILTLKTSLLVIGLGMLIFLIRFPQTEGRAANLDLLSIYKDPVIIYIYITFLPFFVCLYQIFKLLRNIEQNKFYSPAAIKAVRNIKYCSLSFIGFMAAAVYYVFVLSKTTNEDGAGAMVLGTGIIILTGLIAISSTKLQKYLEKRI